MSSSRPPSSASATVATTFRVVVTPLHEKVITSLDIADCPTDYPQQRWAKRTVSPSFVQNIGSRWLLPCAGRKKSTWDKGTTVTATRAAMGPRLLLNDMWLSEVGPRTVLKRRTRSANYPQAFRDHGVLFFHRGVGDAIGPSPSISVPQPNPPRPAQTTGCVPACAVTLL
jgi:hypothetical protein